MVLMTRTLFGIHQVPAHRSLLAKGALFTLFVVCTAKQGMTQAPASPAPSELDKYVSQRIDVEENENVFTVFAFLNVAGYNDEVDSVAMTPIRQKVRSAALAALSEAERKRIKEFYITHRVSEISHTYAVAAIVMQSPPEFRYSQGWSDLKATEPYKSLNELPDLLRDFYRDAHIHDLYLAGEPEYRSAIESERTAILTQVRKVMLFCRIDSPSQLNGQGELKRSVVIPNLLESHQRATSLEWDDVFYSVEGPQTHPGYNPHEFVHSITNPLSYNPANKSLQQRAAPVLEAVKSLPEIQGTYDSLAAYLDENLVRAISLKYLENGDAKRTEILRDALMKEYESGFVLEKFFYDQLDEFAHGSQSLATFYPMMLSRIDSSKELQDWRKATGKH